jgi:hypothetical protein
MAREAPRLEAKVIYEQLHPEAKMGGAPGKANGDKTAGAAPGAAPFTRDMAERTCMFIRAVREDVQIAGKLTPEAKGLLRDTPLADEKAELIRVARLPAAKQERARPAGARQLAWLRSGAEFATRVESRAIPSARRAGGP